jgi:hypothetical protein
MIPIFLQLAVGLSPGEVGVLVMFRWGGPWGLSFVCCLSSVDVMQNCEGSLS